MSLPAPYYQDDFVTLYHGDCLEILPSLGSFDLILTDPPYGIGRDKGGMASNWKKSRCPSSIYCGAPWDKTRPVAAICDALEVQCGQAIVWGGNYLTDLLPQSNKWLVWEKQNTMPSFSDAELAWTSLRGDAVKMMSYPGNGLARMAIDPEPRRHPTQKPLSLMLWCIQLADASNKSPVQTILDPFAGSGTTGRAAKDLGRKCVLIEREEQYCEVTANRLSQEVLTLGDNP